MIEVECLGACGFATPVMINDEFIESVTPETVPDICSAKLTHEWATRTSRTDARRRSSRSTSAIADARTLDGWKKRGGYEALEKALAWRPPRSSTS